MSLQRLASKGRYGDNTLLHVHPSELAGLAALTGKPITINPETGLPEMFSWKKLLAGIGLGAAALLTGGVAGGLLPVALQGIAPGLLGAAAASTGLSALKPNEKKTSGSGSEASKAIDARQRQIRQPQTFYAPMTVDSPMRPNLLGIENPPFQVNQAGISALDISPARYAKGGCVNRYADGGQLEPEEQQAKDIVMQYLAALQGQHQNPQMAENQFVEYYGPQAAQDLRRGGMIQGPGGGMDDMVTASVNGTKALVSNDEFVVPADVVSGLGDGSSSAGARKLHAMMNRVRQQKTGRVKQPGKISNKILPR